MLPVRSGPPPHDTLTLKALLLDQGTEGLHNSTSARYWLGSALALPADQNTFYFTTETSYL